MYFVAVSIRVSRKELVWVTALWVLGAAAAAGISVVLGLDTAYNASAADEGGRSALKIGDYAANLNEFGAALVAPLALAMGGVIGFRRWFGQLLSMAAVAAIAAAIFFTVSRGALAAVLVAGAVFVFRFRLRWKILLIAALMIGLVVVLPSTFMDRILAIADKDTTGSGRTGIWGVALQALGTYGLVGGGFRSFGEVYGLTVPLNPNQGGRGAHNIYLGTWVELGIVGLVILLVAVTAPLWTAHRVRGSGARMIITHAAEAGCYGVLVAAFFSDVLWRKFFWLPYILLAWSVQEEKLAPSEIGPEKPSPQTRAEPRPED
jgi:O-antigen ligase